METAFLAIYITVSLFLYVIIDFKLRKYESLSHNKCDEKFARVESGMRRLEDDYKRSICCFENMIEEIKTRNSSTDK
jgi:hypothetical protein